VGIYDYNELPSAGNRAEAQLTGPESHGGPRGGRTPPFSVRAISVRSGQRSRGQGQLFVSPDAVVFAPFAWDSKSTGTGELVDSGREVTLTTALLYPPWAQTFLILSHGDWVVRVQTSMFARRRLRRALREAGLTVAGQTSWRPPPIDAPAHS
jgi:hypothetical protein